MASTILHKIIAVLNLHQTAAHIIVFMNVITLHSSGPEYVFR